jgi:hypothetical protein
MRRDPDKAIPSWDDADVLIAPTGSDIPASGSADFSDDWEFVGLLDGDAGFTQSRSFDTSRRRAWGGILFGSSARNFEETHQFTMFEKNATTMGILYPGSDVTWTGNDFTGTLKVPDLTHRFMIAFVKHYGDVEERLISAKNVQVTEFGDIESTEENGESYPVTVLVYPREDEALWIVQRTGSPSAAASISVAPATSSKAAGSTTQLVVTATNTDSSTEDVTEFCTYTSSDETKATVDDDGLIHFIATGSATITAHLDALTDTCAVTVT